MELYHEDFDHLPTISSSELNDQEVLEEISKLKNELSEKVVVLGHHYQSDEIISFADITGDSLVLSQKAAKVKKPYVIFCGVHFMAETADIVGHNDQKIILPDLNAGCSMADMADIKDINQAWDYFRSCTYEKIIPVTYVNCSADLKAFVGEHDGYICTSSNAEKIIKQAFNDGEKLLFFPDQHLGRNTCFNMGVTLDQMCLYDPAVERGGLSKEEVLHSKVILWNGFCSVHQGFTKAHIDQIRLKSPKTHVIVHPECSFDVVQNADSYGATSKIITEIERSPAGSEFAVGTEINLVNRLAQKFPDKVIKSLSPYQCLCTTMYRVRPRWLLEVFRSIKREKPINVISVPSQTKEKALLALNRMLAIS